jgi:hypothetical protein
MTVKESRERLKLALSGGNFVLMSEEKAEQERKAMRGLLAKTIRHQPYSMDLETREMSEEEQEPSADEGQG